MAPLIQVGTFANKTQFRGPDDPGPKSLWGVLESCDKKLAKSFEVPTGRVVNCWQAGRGTDELTMTHMVACF